MPSAEWNSFVYLYHCGVNGITPEPPTELPDPDKLLELADRQAATGAIAAALRNAPRLVPPGEGHGAAASGGAEKPPQPTAHGGRPGDD